MVQRQLFFWMILFAPCLTLGQSPIVYRPIAMPPAVTAAVSTQVVFSARIGSVATVIPTGVQLLQVDAVGNVLNSAASLNDQGLAGDDLPGDGVFSTTITINETQPTVLYWQISAAFRGRLRRSLSQVIALEVTPASFPNGPTRPDSTNVVIDPETNQTVVCNEIDLTFAPGTASSAISSLVSAAGGTILGRYWVDSLSWECTKLRSLVVEHLCLRRHVRPSKLRR